MDDQAIIQLYLAREESAITETHRKYGNYCGRIARNILPTHEDAEECLNDTWLQAWNTIPPQEPRNFRVYLGCLVRTISINLYARLHAKKRCGEMEVLLSELEECIPSRHNVEAEVDGGALSALISRWLTSLPETDRRLFLRRYWYGEQVQALALEQGCSPNAMASRMRRLRRGLQSELEKEGIAI